ncbi:putative cytochrome P450 6a14 [Pseudolycoriella hygida]|uniref:Cytochrome P450 6a14 n=1 Tax=Pseudolycoriella hygida TaxID=35572 RepID=A0A9Q0MNS7_9DIPT|nr:putative cytochrome P450 6a14 [Pseudolycoriella hygida]
MSFTLTVTLLSIAVSALYFWIRRRFQFFKENGFPFERPTFPFGNLKGVGRNFHQVYKIKELYEKFKGKAPAFGIYFFVSPNVVVTDLELVKNVLVRDFDNFHNRGLFFNEKDDPLGAQLFTIEDAEWKKMRGKLTPTFTSGKMKMMFETVVEIADLMKKQFEKNSQSGVIEVKEALASFTTDVIGNVAFGLEMNSISDPDAKFRQMGKKIFELGTNTQIKILLMTSFRNLARKLHMTLFPKEVADFFVTTIRETVKYRQEKNIQRNDVMNLLMNLLDTSGTDSEDKITLNELAANCFVFFFAGFETSSSLSTFVLYALSINNEIQEQLRNEITNVLANHGGKLTYEGMQEMKYLQMVIDETLRMYGPIFQLLRKASSDYKIPGSNLVIQKGTLVLIPTYSIHMDPDNYPQPEKFDPNRFSDENKEKRHPMAFLPFGSGPRNCIGLRFGLMQTKIALIKLLASYKFSPSSRTTIPMRFHNKSLVLAPPDGMWLKVEKL